MKKRTLKLNAGKPIISVVVLAAIIPVDVLMFSRYFALVEAEIDAEIGVMLLVAISAVTLPVLALTIRMLMNNGSVDVCEDHIGIKMSFKRSYRIPIEAVKCAQVKENGPRLEICLELKESLTTPLNIGCVLFPFSQEVYDSLLQTLPNIQGQQLSYSFANMNRE